MVPRVFGRVVALPLDFKKKCWPFHIGLGVWGDFMIHDGVYMKSIITIDEIIRCRFFIPHLRLW
jgi:hypothetical protein